MSEALLVDAFKHCFTKIMTKNAYRRFDHGQDQMVSECILNYVEIVRNIDEDASKAPDRE